LAIQVGDCRVGLAIGPALEWRLPGDWRLATQWRLGTSNFLLKVRSIAAGFVLVRWRDAYSVVGARTNRAVMMRDPIFEGKDNDCNIVMSEAGLLIAAVGGNILKAPRQNFAKEQCFCNLGGQHAICR
jgi:hypothetical protein